MGEVTEMFDVTPALVRYWCEQFPTLRPKRNAKGNRLFTPNDIDQLKLIYHLLKEKRLTIEGAKKAMRKERIVSGKATDDMALLEQLQHIKAMLETVREGIGEEVEEPKAVTPTSQTTTSEGEMNEGEEKPKRRRTRRKLQGEEGVVERPLFPFFEQTLF
jgi:DNA-binding transcriptional MerR regulator